MKEEISGASGPHRRK